VHEEEKPLEMSPYLFTHRTITLYASFGTTGKKESHRASCSRQFRQTPLLVSVECHALGVAYGVWPYSELVRLSVVSKRFKS
jgi:hypothetical protein